MSGTTTWAVRGQRLSGKDTRPADAPRATIVAPVSYTHLTLPTTERV